jgi:hypothetical protein
MKNLDTRNVLWSVRVACSLLTGATFFNFCGVLLPLHEHFASSDGFADRKSAPELYIKHFNNFGGLMIV